MQKPANMDIATPTLPTSHARGAATDGIDAEVRESPAQQYYGLSPEDEFLLPLLAWSDPIVQPEQRRVLAVLEWLAEQAPECIDADSLAASVRGAFARAVLELTHRVLLLEWGGDLDRAVGLGQPAKRDFGAFAVVLADGARRARIESDYPLLRQEVQQRARQTARALIAMLRRVVRDHADLRNIMGRRPNPGRLVRLRGGLGHRYCGGQSATELMFEHGRLIYKPKSLAIDAAYANFLAWMAEQGAGPPQYVLQVLDCGDYGYQEALTAAVADGEHERVAYYSRLGGLLALSRLLGTTGLEPGSLMACGAYPVLIDAELAMQASPIGRNSKALSRDPCADTVLSSGLLPHAGNMLEDAGGASQVPVPDQCLFARRAVAHGEELELYLAEPARYVEQICAGFQTTYETLLRGKEKLAQADGPLACFRTSSLRVRVRSTKLYDTLLDALLHPDCLRLAEKREAVLRRLYSEGDTRLQRLCWQAERQALLRGDVPYLYARSTACEVWDGGNRLGKAFGGAAWSEMQKRVRDFSANDLRRQTMLLRELLSSASARHVEGGAVAIAPVPQSPAKSARFPASAYMAAALDIGNRLLASGFRDGELLRYRQMRNDAGGKPVLTELGTRLYDELAGLALFLGELYVHSGATRFLRGAERILHTVRRERARAVTGSEGLGGFLGVGGWAYVLAFLGLRWNRADLVEEALALLPEIRFSIAGDSNMNVAGGAAGALLVLTELDRVAPFRGALAAAQLCAAHLAVHARKDKRGARWDCAYCRIGGEGGVESVEPIGFAHGNAGIAAALGRFGAHAGHDKYIALAYDAVRHERHAIDKRGAATPGAGWCCGPAGIGLGRLALPFELRDEAWQREVERCVLQASEAGVASAHTLGHGSLAELELLIAFSQQFPGKEAAHAAVRRARELLESGSAGWRSECGSGYTHYGLVCGLAGIGYGLLRVARPHHVPAVSLLELPHQYGAL